MNLRYVDSLGREDIELGDGDEKSSNASSKPVHWIALCNLNQYPSAACASRISLKFSQRQQEAPGKHHQRPVGHNKTPLPPPLAKQIRGHGFTAVAVAASLCSEVNRGDIQHFYSVLSDPTGGPHDPNPQPLHDRPVSLAGGARSSLAAPQLQRQIIPAGVELIGPAIDPAALLRILQHLKARAVADGDVH
eukprot:CAMPEP_0182514990 /NCGR_PEP_ID=MMETSP1321-20130603/37105_1 /TAXON_ID=91990 /ORGANISM="Bolidomonas sp., Strain RCC1657" /LENGTH=190 /DNA_ID=CAMNT_0024722327 /DNA_START=188 /DNA_END=763 /DNA_ORIENTATION=-